MCSSSIAPFYQFRTVCAILLLMLCLSAAAAKSLDEYPNPFDDTYRQCNLAEQVEFLCDPDRVLNDEDRGKLAKLLREFPATTRSINGNLWCKWNGLRIAIATANTSYGFGHFDAAEKLLKRWGIDNFCRNAVLFFFDAELREIFHAQYSRSNARVFAYEIDGLITKQRQKLRDGKIFEAFRALLEGIRKIVIYRQNNPFPFLNNELEEEGSGEAAEADDESGVQEDATEEGNGPEAKEADEAEEKIGEETEEAAEEYALREATKETSESEAHEGERGFEAQDAEAMNFVVEGITEDEHEAKETAEKETAQQTTEDANEEPKVQESAEVEEETVGETQEAVEEENEEYVQQRTAEEPNESEVQKAAEGEDKIVPFSNDEMDGGSGEFAGEETEFAVQENEEDNESQRQEATGSEEAQMKMELWSAAKQYEWKSELEASIAELREKIEKIASSLENLHQEVEKFSSGTAQHE